MERFRISAVSGWVKRKSSVECRAACTAPVKAQQRGVVQGRPVEGTLANCGLVVAGHTLPCVVGTRKQ